MASVTQQRKSRSLKYAYRNIYTLKCKQIPFKNGIKNENQKL